MKMTVGLPTPTRENTTMLADRYGLALSTTSDAARDAYVPITC